jgi:hypothetical protein
MSTTSLTDNTHALDVLLVPYPGEDGSPMVNATLLVCDNGAALVDELPPDTEDEAGGRMPTAEVYCLTSRSFFDVIRCGDDLMAFPTTPARRDDTASGEVIGHVGVDSGMVWLGDPCYIAGRDSDALVDSILADQPDGISTPLGELGGIAVTTPDGDGVFPVLVHRDGDGRVLSVEIDFTL